jgi:hypothetical protein
VAGFRVLHLQNDLHRGVALWDALSGAPSKQVAGVEGDAKKVGGDKSKLRGADPDDANDCAVDCGHDPALPQLPANEHRSGDGQHARDVVQTKVVQHFGFSRARVRANQQRIERMALLRVCESHFLAG